MRAILPIVLLAAACAPVATQPAAAQQSGAGGARALEQLEKADANGDGMVTRPEFTAHRKSQFPRLDRNGDGYFTDSDVPRLMKNRMPAGFSPGEMREQFDSNGDAKVSEQEFVSGPSPVFERVDVNGDDQVSTAELKAARAALAQR